MAEESENKKNELSEDIYKELDRISKMEDSIETFNDLAERVKTLKEDGEEKNVLEKDEAPPILSAKDKKRYENLGKAFMGGASAIIDEIQNSIRKKEAQSLADKDNIEAKIKAAEEKVEKEKSKKSSILKKILVAGAVLGGLYLIFSTTVNGSLDSLYEKIKNGIMGFGDFIKKSGAAIFQFFGNMFIKASQALRGGGTLTIVLISILREFFTYTLPWMIRGLTEDLVRLIAPTFKSSVVISKNTEELELNVTKNVSENTSLMEELANDANQLSMVRARDIRNNGILSANEQERFADESIGIVGNTMNSVMEVVEAQNNLSEANTEHLAAWSSSIFGILSSNKISSTAFYENASSISESIVTLIPGITGTVQDAEKSLTRIQQQHVKNFARNNADALMMTEEQVLAYEAMSLAGQITFLKQLQSGMMGFREDVNERLENAEENSSSEEERKQNKTTSELLTLVREMKDDVQKKEGELKIIQFQEVEELGHLHHSIKSFLNSNKFDEAIGSMAEILDNKFSLILDASNKTLANLTHAITSQFTLKSGDETVTVGGLDEEAETELMGTRTVEVPEDYKLLYVFNNTANSNDTAITQSMHKFMEHNSSYLDLLKKEVRLMTELEHVTLLLFGGIKGHTSMLNEKYKKTNEYISDHISLPINISSSNTTIKNAHSVIKSTPLASGQPLHSKGSGKNLI